MLRRHHRFLLAIHLRSIQEKVEHIEATGLLVPVDVRPAVAQALELRQAFVGGAPEFDRPSLPKDDKEKQALSTLEEMTRGRWYLNVTTREGRVLRQLTEAVGAKRVVEIGTSSGYSGIWLALALLMDGSGDLLLMRLTFMGYGVSPARDVSKFRFPIFARADRSAFESRDERARLSTA